VKRNQFSSLLETAAKIKEGANNTWQERKKAKKKTAVLLRRNKRSRGLERIGKTYKNMFAINKSILSDRWGKKKRMKKDTIGMTNVRSFRSRLQGEKGREDWNGRRSSKRRHEGVDFPCHMGR